MPPRSIPGNLSRTPYVHSDQKLSFRQPTLELKRQWYVVNSGQTSMITQITNFNTHLQSQE